MILRFCFHLYLYFLLASPRKLWLFSFVCSFHFAICRDRSRTETNLQLSNGQLMLWMKVRGLAAPFAESALLLIIQWRDSTEDIWMPGSAIIKGEWGGDWKRRSWWRSRRPWWSTGPRRRPTWSPRSGCLTSSRPGLLCPTQGATQTCHPATWYKSFSEP